ncbi:MAG: carotenoid biosynthesis protein [Candidatus Thermoplasmatota archaeon]|nr:carotenoid biosynthesis protein [Candidatus Thermoplasmatota archaeon]
MDGHLHDDRGKWLDPVRTPKLALVVLALIVFMFALARLLPTGSPGEEWGTHGDRNFILHAFELTCLALMIASFLHARIRWGLKDAMLFFTVGLAYGVILEDITVTFSGYYTYNPDAWIQVHNTMMAVPFCWTAVIYVCLYVIDENPKLRSLARIEKGLLAGVLAVSLDVGIDSVFAAYGLWHWAEGQWFGVPMANFTAWFMAVGGFVVIWDDMRSLKAHRVVREMGMILGSALSYAALLVMVYLTYVASEVVF